jgi:hypothetical protein
VTLRDALAAVEAAGAILTLGDDGRPRLLGRLRGQVDPGAVEVLRDHRERVSAILQLREVHRAMGLSAEHVTMVEEAMLSGRIAEVRIAARPPSGVSA